MNHYEKKTIITTYIDSELRSSIRKISLFEASKKKYRLTVRPSAANCLFWFYLKAMKKKQKNRPLDLKLIMNWTWVDSYFHERIL